MNLHSLHLVVDGPVARLRLDHGKANEMGSAEIADWEALAAWLETGAVRVLVTHSTKRSGSGKPVFIAGANVTERVGWSPEAVKTHVRRQRTALARLRAAPVFHVAVVDGVALGWGTEFLLTCDWRIATPAATMGLPETGLGILPGAGGTAELPAYVGLSQALRLGMTGETVGGEEAVRIGLADELQPDLDAGLARADALAARVVRRSPTAVAAFKAATLAALGRPGPERAALEALAYEHCADTGEAAVGRANFAAILSGQGEVPWGPFRRWTP